MEELFDTFRFELDVLESVSSTAKRVEEVWDAATTIWGATEMNGGSTKLGGAALARPEWTVHKGY